MFDSFFRRHFHTAEIIFRLPSRYAFSWIRRDEYLAVLNDYHSVWEK